MGPSHLKKMEPASGISGTVVILKICILIELGAVDDSRLPIFILIRFWEIRKFPTNGYVN
jgi:hypothetical protein